MQRGARHEPSSTSTFDRTARLAVRRYGTAAVRPAGSADEHERRQHRAGPCHDHRGERGPSHRAGHHHRHRAEPQPADAVGADRAADRHRATDRHAGGHRPQQDESVRARPGGQRQPADPAQLSIARHQHRRLRRGHRIGGGRVCRRRLRRAFRRRPAGVQRHPAHRGAERPARHAVRPQCRRRRDLDRHQRAQRPARGQTAPALRQLRQALRRRAGEPATQRQHGAAPQRGRQPERRLDQGRRQRPALRSGQRPRRARGVPLEHHAEHPRAVVVGSRGAQPAAATGIRPDPAVGMVGAAGSERGHPDSAVSGQPGELPQPAARAAVQRCGRRRGNAQV